MTIKARVRFAISWVRACWRFRCIAPGECGCLHFGKITNEDIAKTKALFPEWWG